MAEWEHWQEMAKKQVSGSHIQIPQFQPSCAERSSALPTTGVGAETHLLERLQSLKCPSKVRTERTRKSRSQGNSGLLQPAESREVLTLYYGCTLGVSAGQKTDWTVGKCDNLP